MAGNLSNYLQPKILDLLFSNVAYSIPATLYFALYTVTPTNAGGGTEASGGSYARVTLTNNATNFPAAPGTSPATKGNGSFSFAAATADWSAQAPMVAWGIFDALTSGNLLVWGPLTENKIVYNGDTVTVAANGLAITID